MSHFWLSSRDDVVGGILVALAAAVTGALLLY
jgi:hypothetical protein